MLSVDRCHILSYLRLALCFYALSDTDARHYGNLNHLQISPETDLTRPFLSHHHHHHGPNQT